MLYQLSYAGALIQVRDLEPMPGIEPGTSSLPWMRSTN